MPVTLSAGYNYTETDREASRFQFQYFRPDGALPDPVAQERPDFLLSDFNIYTYNIQLRDVSGAEGAAAYEADLRIHAGYAQAEVELTDGAARHDRRSLRGRRPDRAAGRRHIARPGSRTAIGCRRRR